jgi:hypothetical protein
MRALGSGPGPTHAYGLETGARSQGLVSRAFLAKANQLLDEGYDWQPSGSLFLKVKGRTEPSADSDRLKIGGASS